MRSVSTAHYAAEILDEAPPGDDLTYVPEGGRRESPVLVRVSTEHGRTWIGAFGAGTRANRALSCLFPTASAWRVCVVSMGAAYLVDVRSEVVCTVLVPELVMDGRWVESAGLLLLADPWEIRAYGERGLEWRSGRICTEGLEILRLEDGLVVARSDGADGEPEELALDLATGKLVRVR